MADEVITIDRDGAVAVVTLNRPASYNASNAELHARLATIWTDLAAMADLRAVVVTGAGDAFSAGGDLELLQTMVDDIDVRAATMAEGGVITRAIVEFPLPIISAVNGPAVGLGCSLTGLSDLVVMAQDAYLSDPHVSLGLVAGDGAVFTWPALIGLQRAKEWVLLGGRISADEAYRIGLANRVVPAGEALPRALELAHQIAKLPPQAVRETLAGFNRSLRSRLGEELEEILAAESRSFDEPAFRRNLAGMLSRSSS
jgi:enoyl-CoA hydratase